MEPVCYTPIKFITAHYSWQRAAGLLRVVRLVKAASGKKFWAAGSRPHRDRTSKPVVRVTFV
jgi:hypothetical protein